MAAGADRLPRRADAVARLSLNEGLDDAVFQRVIAEHRKTAKVAQEAVGLRERVSQAEEFLINCDPKGLKRPGGGVGLASGPSAYGLLDDLG